jgi:hypothetical protein
MKAKLRKTVIPAVAAAILSLTFAGTAQAHCDALDGPVITEARAALESGNVTPLLKWVPSKNEAEIKRVFADVRKVREQSETAKELVDQHLFSTLVEIHRASEGAPFTGIKPSGQIDPGLMAADETLKNRQIDRLVTNITRKIEDAIRERYNEAQRARAMADQSVDKGRAFVADYVNYIHYIEGVHGAAGAQGH